MFWLKPKDNKLEPQMQFVEPQELWYNLFSYFLPFRNNFFIRDIFRENFKIRIFFSNERFLETFLIIFWYFWYVQIEPKVIFRTFLGNFATFFTENVDFPEKNQFFKNRTEKLKFEI